jgi:hypothetical protein
MRGGTEIAICSLLVTIGKRLLQGVEEICRHFSFFTIGLSLAGVCYVWVLVPPCVSAECHVKVPAVDTGTASLLKGAVKYYKQLAQGLRLQLTQY